MMMTCRDLYGFLDEFLDGTLDGGTRQTFESHLEKCAACRKYLVSYQTTLKVARGAELSEVSARTEVPEVLIQAILTARTTALIRQPPE